MDQCQIDCVDDLKITHDVQHETNMKSIKHANIKKSTSESDHRTSKRKNDISNSNNLKKKKKYESALAAIFPENDQSYSQYAQDYAEGYMKKMRERLDIESFDKAVKLLASFGDADDININLVYQEIIELFSDKNEDLIYEFLGFLHPGQASSIGKFTDYLELTRIKEFIRKLQVCMKKQPTQVRKILDNLIHLSKSNNITSLEVHTVMFPLLKSNPILVDCFFQLIPTERPPESFFSDDNWEDLDIDQSINCGIDYEEMILSDSEDLTLLNLCHCVCHKFGDNTHCRSCGLKFFKGRIYFDTPEGLKLAKINFEGADPSIVQSKIDKTEENVAVKQKNRKSLIKNSSPGSAEDIKGSTGTESEEDLIDVKPKKRQKSKVVQSLKLKFKKEDSPKCKEEQETYNESGKSIVHVTNEELNSSEMAFFCIPKTETSIKISPKKKHKIDVKENITQKESEIINQINTVTSNLNVSNSINQESSIKMNDKTFLDVNTSNNASKEIKPENNLIPSPLTISNSEVDKLKFEYQIFTPNKIEMSNQSLKVKSDLSQEINSTSITHQKKLNELIEETVTFLDVNTSNNASKEIKLENNLIPPPLVINNSVIDKLKCEYQILTPNEIELSNQSLKVKTDLSQEINSSSNTHQKSLNELIKETVTNDITNQKPFVDQNASASLTNDCYSCGPSTSTVDINESLLIENVTIKNDVNPPKPNIDIEKQLISKWTIDEDKIILQTCKRVEDIEVLLETIKRRIPLRSVSEIQERFTTLMTLLEQMIVVKHS